MDRNDNILIPAGVAPAVGGAHLTTNVSAAPVAGDAHLLTAGALPAAEGAHITTNDSVAPVAGDALLMPAGVAPAAVGAPASNTDVAPAAGDAHLALDGYDAEAGLPSLKKARVSILKAYLRNAKLRLSGNKSELYSRVQEHIKISSDIIDTSSPSKDRIPSDVPVNPSDVPVNLSDSDVDDSTPPSASNDDIDIISRAPSIEFILSQLKISEEYTYAVKYNTCNEDRIMMEYMNVDFWSNLLEKVLMNIQDCSFFDREGVVPSSKLIVSRSKLYSSRRFEMMQEAIQLNMPPICMEKLERFKIEWKSTLCTLVYAFFSIVHRTLSFGPIDNVIEKFVKEVSDDSSLSYVPANLSLLAQNVYYVAGFLIHSAEKESIRGGGETDRSINLEKLVDACQCIDDEHALEFNLPIDRVKRL